MEVSLSLSSVDESAHFFSPLRAAKKGGIRGLSRAAPRTTGRAAGRAAHDELYTTQVGAGERGMAPRLR